MLLDLIQSLATCLDREAAGNIARFQPDNQIRNRLAELTLKDRQGHLTDDERMELQMLIHAQNFISVLQREARAILRRRPHDLEH